MASVITPIPTLYKGCKFRSRLEARYAVLFDELDIKWEYEKEGFTITLGWSEDGYGTRNYLPDFYLPESKTWVEVKGSVEDVTDDYWYMLACAVDWGGYLPHVSDSLDTERGLVVLSGIPSPEILPLFPIIQHSKGGWCGAVQLTDNGFEFSNLGGQTYFDASWGEEAGTEIKKHCIRILDREYSPESEIIKKAITKARSARFEHGETPITKHSKYKVDSPNRRTGQEFLFDL